MYFVDKKIAKITDELKKQMYPESFEINCYKMKKGKFRGGEHPTLDDSSWDNFPIDGRWGGKDTHFWFRTKVVIPQSFERKCVVYRLKTGREGQWDATNPQMLIYINGVAVQGLDTNHTETEISASAAAGEEYSIALDAYSGMVDCSIELLSSLAVLDKDIEKLYYDIKIPLNVADLLDKEDMRRIDILTYLDNAVNMLDLRKPHSQSYYDSIKKADEYLQKEFYQKYCGHEDCTAVCVGHTHIDVAWLWTLAQTRDKAGRSFSTVLNLMEKYPEYIFMSSQPQLYQFVKQDYPLIYEKIKERIKEGRWEAEGAMWLEADCNITSGESLIRQILFGKRFFKKEFDVENRVLWLPDVFGYSAALPQILKKSGVEYFVTSKISWNEYNKLPYDTFMWKGIDGTEILTHFITTTTPAAIKANSHFTTYNGKLTPAEVCGAWQRYQQKNINNEVIISYGYGDGGGGTTKQMIESAKRMQKGIPGCPKVRLGNVRDFLVKLDNTVKNNKKLPKWVGELYLEYHRGTYTSMARNKKYNRKSEFMLQDLEWLSLLYDAVNDGEQYPGEEINRCWETVLLNQFHDILPGSSIREVYEDSKKQYEGILQEGSKMIHGAVTGVSSKINLNESSVIVFNQLGFERNDIVETKIPEGYVLFEQGKEISMQKTGRGTVAFLAENIPAKGYKTYVLIKKSDALKADANINAVAKELENQFFVIGFNDDYNITSIFDKRTGREIVQEGCCANVLQAFEDKPVKFDAWDINAYYQDKMWEVNDVISTKIIECGPVRTALQIERRFMDSKIIQTIYMYNGIPRIDFHNIIDWKEKQVLLKAAFPVDVHTDKATYEIQYGNVERPTHWNTSWDFAKFEVCAHKWVDLSEDDYGVSLLNDCKYGCDIKDGVMRLTLLKSAIDPNEDADREVHEFTYSLYPHAGSWRNAGAVQMAYSLNCPAYAKVEQAHAGTLPQTLSMVSVNKDNVIVEVVKKAEDSDDMIIRMYECYNRRTKATIRFFKELLEVWECDLMENNIEAINPLGNCFEMEIRPYEIKTFKLKFK